MRRATSKRAHSRSSGVRQNIYCAPPCVEDTPENERQKVLFVSRNEALGIFFAKWCLGRLRTCMTPKSAWKCIERLYIVSAASGDTEISKCSFDACKSKIACSSIPANEAERIKFALVIVDEAHNVYRKTSAKRDSGVGADVLSKKNATRDIIRSCLSKDITPNGDGQLVLLSDASQSSDECDFPDVADMKISICGSVEMHGAHYARRNGVSDG